MKRQREKKGQQGKKMEQITGYAIDRPNLQGRNSVVPCIEQYGKIDGTGRYRLRHTVHITGQQSTEYGTERYNFRDITARYSTVNFGIHFRNDNSFCETVLLSLLQIPSVYGTAQHGTHSALLQFSKPFLL